MKRKLPHPEFDLVSPITFPAIITVTISARGVMVIVVGNGHGDTSSNPGLD